MGDGSIISLSLYSLSRAITWEVTVIWRFHPFRCARRTPSREHLPGGIGICSTFVNVTSAEFRRHPLTMNNHEYPWIMNAGTSQPKTAHVFSNQNDLNLQGQTYFLNSNDWKVPCHSSQVWKSLAQYTQCPQYMGSEFPICSGWIYA